MTALLADTNVLLRAIQRHDLSLRSAARAALRRIIGRGDVLCVCPQNLIELWSVSTRPVNVNGMGLGVSETRRYIRRCEALFRLLPETPEVFQEWKRLVVRHEVSGLKVYDARLVATMNVYQVRSIVTFDTRDFERYRPGIAVIHPQDVAA